MPLRPTSYREVRRKLEAAGFTASPAGRGSHFKFVKTTDLGTLTAIVPKHREVAVGMLRSILRQAGLSVEEFEKF